MYAHFTEYTNRGWKTIPILPDSKKPFMYGWNKKQLDAESYMRDHECNIGLLLGDIIDVEADSDKANNLLNKLIGDYQHSQYKSQKSIHHLFLTPDKSLTRVVIRGIEFRGARHQSLLPPSIVDGIEYLWLEDCPLTPLPDTLVNFYHNNCKTDNWVSPLCSCCQKHSRPIHKNRFKLELYVFKSLGLKWQCHRCRIDIKSLCRKMKMQHMYLYD
jgi:hypothetical protein